MQCEDPIEVLDGTRMIALVMIAEAPNRKGSGIVWVPLDEPIGISNRALVIAF